MNLPFLSKKEEQKDFFLALTITHTRIGSILFEKSPSNLLILATNEQKIIKEPEKLSDEEIIDYSDKAVTAIEGSLPPAVEVSKTIFAVPYSWVDSGSPDDAQGKIKHEFLAKLKKVCDTLALTPIGFIISIEAIIAYLHRKEGAPVSALVVEVGDIVTVSVVANGKIENVYTRDIGSGAVSTVEEILKEADLEKLPARIILLNSGESKREEQQFTAHQWSKSLPFLHIPRVLSISRGFENEAVINGVASQMGFDIKQNVGAAPSVEKEEVPDISVKKEEPTEERVHQEVEDKPISESASMEGSAFGFLKEEDIAKGKEEEIENQEHEVLVTDHRDRNQDVQDYKPPEGASGSRPSLLSSIPIPRSFSLPSISFPSFLNISQSRSIIFLPILFLVFLLCFSFLYYFLLEKAEITIFLDKREVNRDIPVTFSTEKETSPKDSILKVSQVDVSVDGSEEKNTTGKKETGDKAQGSVTVYNKTTEPKKFLKGAKLSGPNDTSFLTLDDTQVASTSSFSTSFSNSKVKVEASTFGKEFNLPSGSNFSFEGLSTDDYFAKNESAFSGGSKKEIKVVDKKDLAALDEAIISSLTQKAVDEAKGKANSEESVLNKPLSYEFVEKDYTKKAEQEASSVGLSATIKFVLASYKNKDAEEMLKRKVKDIPGLYKMSPESTIVAKDIKNEDDKITGVLKVDADFIPEIDSGALTKTLKMKPVSRTDANIRKIEGVTDVNIAIKNKIPILSALLPFNSRNITVSVKSE